MIEVRIHPNPTTHEDGVKISLRCNSCGKIDPICLQIKYGVKPKDQNDYDDLVLCPTCLNEMNEGILSSTKLIIKELQRVKI